MARWLNLPRKGKGMEAMQRALGTEIELASEAEERVYRKVTLRLVPFLSICYFAAYPDRVNVGLAKAADAA